MSRSWQTACNFRAHTQVELMNKDKDDQWFFFVMTSLLIDCLLQAEMSKLNYKDKQEEGLVRRK